MTPLDTILGQTRAIEKNEYWMGHCPVHDDKEPSLAIRTGDDGKVLLYCHACGKDATPAIVKALGLKMSDLSSNGTQRKERIVYYDYVDANGSLVCQKVRKPNKKFLQRRPDGNGGWIWNLNGTERVLYRLPEVLASDPWDWLFLCEGEKSTDAICNLGLVATCNIEGTSKWRTEYTQILKGRKVCILADNDETGLKFANDTAGLLSGADCEVRVINLMPDVPKGDPFDWCANGGTHDGLLALVEATEAHKSKPSLNAGDLALMNILSETWRVIQDANRDPYLFRFGGLLVRVELDDDGQAIPAILTKERLALELAKIARWYRKREIRGQWKELDALPPKHVVDGILAWPDPPLPVLTTISECPVFGKDGTLAATKGYHAASRTYVWPKNGSVVPAVASNPTAADVERAKTLILDELLGEFPFTGDGDDTGDSEKAHAVALLLLPFVRPMVQGCTPLHLVEKPSPGTGASLLVDVLMLPALGQPVPAMVESRRDDEWRKRLTAKLLASPQVVFIDNLNRRLSAGPLAAAITATRWEDRLLGQSRIVKVPVRCAWVATGNNPSLSNEMARRAIRIRMDAKQDRPWLRTGFKHPNLRAWAKERRGELVWSALTLVQNWIAQSRPPGTESLGMFESWAATIGGILQAADIGGFLENAKEFYDNADPLSALWRALVKLWWVNHKEGLVGTADLYTLITDSDLNLDLGDGSERSQKIRLGKALARQRDMTYAVEFEDENVKRTLRIVRGANVQRAAQWRLDECECVNVVNVSNPGQNKSYSMYDSVETGGGEKHSQHTQHSQAEPGVCPDHPDAGTWYHPTHKIMMCRTCDHPVEQ